jgi:hypothetical protein
MRTAPPTKGRAAQIRRASAAIDDRGTHTGEWANI